MNTLQWVGIGIGGLIILFVIFSIIRNIIRRKRKTGKEENFVFSPKTADKLKALDTSIQFESTIISLLGLIIGSLLMTVYVIFFMDTNWIFKAFMAFNALCGATLLASMLVTQYQQFVMYKMSSQIMGNITNMMDSAKKDSAIIFDEANIDNQLNLQKEDKI